VFSKLREDNKERILREYVLTLYGGINHIEGKVFTELAEQLLNNNLL
jgi:hypothetical protein